MSEKKPTAEPAAADGADQPAALDATVDIILALLQRHGFIPSDEGRRRDADKARARAWLENKTALESGFIMGRLDKFGEEVGYAVLPPPKPHPVARRPELGGKDPQDNYREDWKCHECNADLPIEPDCMWCAQDGVRICGMGHITRVPPVPIPRHALSRVPGHLEAVLGP